jgi:hypothetical protein
MSQISGDDRVAEDAVVVERMIGKNGIRSGQLAVESRTMLIAATTDSTMKSTLETSTPETAGLKKTDVVRNRGLDAVATKAEAATARKSLQSQMIAPEVGSAMTTNLEKSLDADEVEGEIATTKMEIARNASSRVTRTHLASARGAGVIGIAKSTAMTPAVQTVAKSVPVVSPHGKMPLVESLNTTSSHIHLHRVVADVDDRVLAAAVEMIAVAGDAAEVDVVEDAGVTSNFSTRFSVVKSVTNFS